MYSYEVHFRAAPNEAERVAVARAFESALTGTSVDASHYEVRWAADWALFVVEVRSHETDFDYGLFFEDVRDAFKAVNGAAPFWARQGFAPRRSPAMAAKLAGYGADAIYMIRVL